MDFIGKRFQPLPPQIERVIKDHYFRISNTHSPKDSRRRCRFEDTYIRDRRLENKTPCPLKQTDYRKEFYVAIRLSSGMTYYDVNDTEETTMTKQDDILLLQRSTKGIKG